MGIITTLIYVTFFLTLSFSIVNMTGVFPHNIRNLPMSNTNIQSQLSTIKTTVANLHNPISILEAVYTLTTTSVYLMVGFALGLFGVWPGVFELFMVPIPLANLLGGTFDIVMIIGIAQMFRRGS